MGYGLLGYRAIGLCTMGYGITHRQLVPLAVLPSSQLGIEWGRGAVYHT
jgi:hypothetical protein